MRMEKYYYFTTLNVGVSFIENIDASSLNIDPVAFEKYVITLSVFGCIAYMLL